ncbi:hypothetical protein AGDE_13448 [Angomonas deanei]|nr:hypothetical protein AGDE_13448 [Angomonas deanei]|eukprot:EPY22371.1 hypothetical protein AGDE_13448 [Angomonas deanei]
MHDRAAYAIQELLRVYTKKERKEKGMVDLRPDEILHEGELQRYLWWSQLPDKTKRLLEGFFSTKFKTLIYQYPGRKTPEYKKQMPYEIWVVNWFKNLASRCVGAFGDTMVALRNVGKRDISLATYLIPYMVAHILECGDKRHSGHSCASLIRCFKWPSPPIAVALSGRRAAVSAVPQYGGKQPKPVLPGRRARPTVGQYPRRSQPAAMVPSRRPFWGGQA